MEYVIDVFWDDEAEVYVAINDEIPIATESESLDALLDKVKIMTSELIGVNNLIKPDYLYFIIKRREKFE